jgi:hypothetical protein
MREMTTTTKPVEKQLQTYLAQEANKAMSPAANGNKYLSIRSGIMAYQGIPIPGNKIEGVIVASVFENVYYSKPFMPGSADPPDCFAVGMRQEELMPGASVINPVSGLCQGCPNNEWGSAKPGAKGKKCRNIKKLGIIPTVDGEDFSGEVMYLKLPVTSVKNFTTYVNKCAIVLGRPPFAVLTKIAVVPHPVTQFAVSFETIRNVGDKALLEQIVTRIDEVKDVLLIGND